MEATDLPNLAGLVRRLGRAGLSVASAESFTGGQVMDSLTDVAGSSRCFLGGIVAYSDAAKRGLLGVPAATIRTHGAVSEATARAMALGVRRVFRSKIGIATTGIAGPTGARPGKPVGLSIVAVSRGRRVWIDRRVHRGGRAAVKEAATRQALRLLALAAGQNR